MNLPDWRREGVDVSPFVGLPGYRDPKTGQYHHDPHCEDMTAAGLHHGTTSVDSVLCCRCWITALPGEAQVVYANTTYIELAKDEFDDATKVGLTSSGFGWLLEALTQLWDIDGTVKPWAERERTRMVEAFLRARAQRPATWYTSLQAQSPYESAPTEPSGVEGLLYVPKEGAAILSDRLNTLPLERLAAWWEPALGRHGYVFRGPIEVIGQTGSVVRTVQRSDQALRVTWADLQPGDDSRVLDTAIALVEGATAIDDLFVSAGPALHAARAV